MNYQNHNYNQPQNQPQIILSNTESVTGFKIVAHRGLVRGSTVRARNVVRDVFASVRALVGGEVDEYTKLQAQAREQALSRMIADAQRLQANGIVNIRMTTSVITQGAAEILIYGTAVYLEPQ